MKIKKTEITKLMKKAYLDYAMSVIVARALPDVRDGLKPVQRRILYAMYQMGLTPGAKYSKSAKIVGEVLGKYHPHGDAPVYEALVRMAQDFSMRYPLIDGQGNFGSIDGDPPAAMRYTEARMAKIAKEMIADIQKETVDFTDNFDATLKEPVVLPARIPNLLINGADGIAVGMATKIPPHNLGEVIDAAVYMLEHGTLEEKQKEQQTIQLQKLPLDRKKDAKEIIMQEVSTLAAREFEFETKVATSELLQFIKGPDFPTGGEIYDQEAIAQLYQTGRGKIPVRGKAEIEESRGGRWRIIISEIPYQVNKADLVAKIAQLVREKKIVGVADLRDESDRRGIRVVIELRRGARPKAILNKLYKYTELQTSFPANLVALVEGVPQTLNLRQILLLYLRHRHNIVRRATLHDFKEAKFRAHILEGLKIALDNLDEVIETIKKSADAEEAKIKLMEKFDLSELQATAILDMQLRRLAALERAKIEAEYKEVQAKLEQLRTLLTQPRAMLEQLKKELLEIKEKYADARRTRVFAQKLGEFSEEDLVQKQEVLITLTAGGYIKRVPRGTYRAQRRGGKGVVGMTTKDGDEIQHLVAATTHDFILFFTNKGRVFQLRAWEIPEGSRKSKGQAIVNLLNIDSGEKIKAILRYSPQTKEKKFVLLVSQKGVVKKTALEKFANIRGSGLIAIKLASGDQVGWAQLTDGNNQIVLITRQGKAIRFPEGDLRPLGRTARGVRGIRLKEGDQVVAAEVIPASLPEPSDKRKKVFRHLLLVGENGIGKKTDVYTLPLQHRGGVGVKIMNLSEKTGKLACARLIDEGVETIVLTSKKAQVIKLPVKNIPLLSRNARGVILMRLTPPDTVAAIACLRKS